MSNSSPVLAFMPDEDTFFDDLVTMLISLSAYLFTIHVTVLSNNPKKFRERGLDEWISYIRPVKDPQHFLALDVHSTNQSMVFFPFWLTSPVSLNNWPQYIEYRYVSDLNGISAYSISSDKNTKIVSRIVGASFVNYFESQRDAIEAKYGQHVHWPDTLNFARHVRNGFAHGGEFNIRNRNTAPVSWRIWQIDYSLDGKSVLFGSHSPGIGDLICLMADVNKLQK